MDYCVFNETKGTLMALSKIPQDILDQYAAHIQKSYDDWNTSCNYPTRKIGIEFEVGRKFIKVIRNDGQRSVHSFIINADDYKFPLGTILKSANYKAPALNAGRGNVLTKDWNSVSWTGPAYLK